MINTITKNYYQGRFVSYTITYQNSDMIKSVPLSEDNTDYQEIMKYIENGGIVIDNGGNN